MKKIAITGNIASGKSTVEDIISQYYPVFDSDKIAHKILGNIDRKELAKKVFSDKKFKEDFEKEIHPKIKAEIRKIFDENQNEQFIFVSVPLLFEAKFEDLFDKILIIALDDDLRLKRLIKRNDYTKEEALIRINSQIPQDEKIKKADFVIYNNSTFEELKSEVKKFLEILSNTY